MAFHSKGGRKPDPTRNVPRREYFRQRNIAKKLQKQMGLSPKKAMATVRLGDYRDMAIVRAASNLGRVGNAERAERMMEP